VQCTSAVVFSVCRDNCIYPYSFQTLDRVAWYGPVLDIDPGDSGAAPGPGLSCYGFSFSDFGAQEIHTEPFTSSGAVPKPEADDACQPDPASLGYNFRDEDFDGVYDVCDPVLASVAPADGFQRITLKNKVRNEGFLAPFDPPTDEVFLGTVPAEIVVAESDATKLVVTVPPSADLAPKTIVVNPLEESLTEAAQPFIPRWFGYANNHVDRLLVLDAFAEAARDGNASPTNSFVNLHCDDADTLTQVGAPRDLAIRPFPTGDVDFPLADRQVFLVSDVIEGGQTDFRIFGFDVQTQRLVSGMPQAGVDLPGSGRALDIALDQAGYWQAFVARRLGPDTGTLTVVNVDPARPPLWSQQDGAARFLTLTGMPLGIRVRHIAGEGTFAFVTSVHCGEVLSLAPCPIEGCPPDTRREMYLSVVDATDPATSMTLEDEFLLSSAVEYCTESDTLASNQKNLGLEFNLDKDVLLVVNPDQDRVEVVYLQDAPAGCVDRRPFTSIPVGDHPVDVAVVNKGGDRNNARERAYVVNRYANTLTEIDLGTTGFPVLGTIELVPEWNNYPVAVAARADGNRLFVATFAHQSITVVDIKPGSDWENTFVDDLGARDPSRLVLLAMPTP
jgi:hypothetical protein